MNGLWTVCRREIDERRLLLLGAVILGALPFAAALLPTELGRDLSNTRLEAAAILALVAGGVTALVVGASVIAGDLAERRLGFYFQRPLSGWAIWGGKLSAAAGLCLATAGLIVLPALLADLSRARARPLSGWLALGGIGAIVALLGLAHAGGIILRARSPWLLLDFAGALLACGLLSWATAYLMGAGVFSLKDGELDILEWGQLGLAAALLVCTLAAAAVQVLTARTDLRRGHRALSLALWAGLLAAALLFCGFARWVTSVTPADLRAVEWVEAAPAGPWIAVGGPAVHRPGYQPVFLLDTAAGRAVTLAAVSSGGPPLLFSADGRHAAWLAPTFAPGPRPRTLVAQEALMSMDLADPRARPVSTPLSFLPPPQALALSPAGDRVAVIDRNRLAVYQVADARIVASVALERGLSWTRQVRFLADGRVRFTQQRDEPRRPLGTSGFDLLDVTIGPPARTAQRHVEALADGPSLETSPDGRYLVAWKSDRPVILDVATGREAFPLPPTEPGTRQYQVVFLADGRAVQLLATAKSRGLRLLGPDFREERRILMADDRPLTIGGLLAPGRLGVAQAGPHDLGYPQRYDASLVDLATGDIRPLGRGLAPATLAWGAGPESLAPRLFLHGRGLVRIDPETGRATAIVPTGAPLVSGEARP